MPFNRGENPFNVSDDYFLNIGEATGEWKMMLNYMSMFKVLLLIYDF